ncbi:hypothetical protein BVG16_26580 [Paenibacillus selenitireducens]|uniref:Uncharacterized protein n=1 Tax=Paenibacillus selenitireducens TaxID=1324314 RepID=A0A1T2X1A7_9BACL|nr:hypothetical protein BVG16_26580 [Paenibacillus selenitireducens]
MLIGSYEFKDVVTHEKHSKLLENELLGKRIITIRHCEPISDLYIEFEDNLILELFHNSSYYEGWQLSGENGFLLVSLPGGKYALWEE